MPNRRDLLLFSLAILALCIGLCARAALSQPLGGTNLEQALSDYLGTLKAAHGRLLATPVTVCVESEWGDSSLVATNCSISTVGELDPKATAWHGFGTTREGIAWHLEDMERIRGLETLSQGPGHACETLGCSGWDEDHWAQCLGVDCAPVPVPEGRVATLLMVGLIGLGILARARQ